ncbi:MAG: translation initiation factor IF-2 N-terminal domain-containing protein, partial [Actinomycetota bacterium]|nr:translation initiation factor IF-2 N-terminal domain-containing protein [Actinomycetota bacterium]
MSKVRIYELAKETGLPNKEVIRRLTELGVDARSHSSTVEAPDAARFRDSLGRLREARRKQQDEREQREAEEYDLSALQAPASGAKARRVLPPHLRRQAEEQAAPAEGQPAAPRFRPPATPFKPGAPTGVSVGGADEPPAPGSMEGVPGDTAPDEAAITEVPAAAEQPGSRMPAAERPATAIEAARAGVVRPPRPPAPPRAPAQP